MAGASPSIRPGRRLKVAAAGAAAAVAAAADAIDRKQLVSPPDATGAGTLRFAHPLTPDQDRATGSLFRAIMGRAGLFNPDPEDINGRGRDRQGSRSTMVNRNLLRQFDV